MLQKLKRGKTIFKNFNFDDSDNFVLLADLISDNFMLFKDPVKVLTCYKLKDVEKILEQIPNYLNNGYFIAGYLTYEAGFFSSPHLMPLLEGKKEKPLLWFGVYDKVEKLKGSPFKGDIQNSSRFKISNFNFEYTQDQYVSKINQIKKYIQNGDTYQINFTGKLSFNFEGSPSALFQELSKKQKVCYASFIKHNQKTILSLSPELFFHQKGSSIFVKPMKGTLKKGKNPKENQKLKKELFNCPKNRAENLMIVDLLRNDLNRICKTGSVQSSSLFDIETYKTLFQMTSSIKGELLEKEDYVLLFKSLFPCGSITGAPKISSMQIIDKLEESERGIYTGNIGYFSPNGESCFNVAIRTLELEPEKAQMGIGGGIVWDSEPLKEYDECFLKASFLTKL